jgi:hypothetical protein
MKPTKLVSEEPKGATHIDLAKDSVQAVEFSDRHVPAWSFDMSIRMGESWLQPGAALLRASRVVMRQCLLDGSRQKKAIESWKPGDDMPPMLAQLHLEVLFLAAFAVENALKAVIAGGMSFLPPNSAPSGELPAQLRGHDLCELAIRAGIMANDEDEKEALKRGQNFTEWLGRYPSPIAHDEQHSSVSVADLRSPVAAYERLFFRCVEEVARRTCHRFPDGNHASKRPDEFALEERARYEKCVGDIDPLPPGTEPGRMGFGQYSVTATTTGAGGK